MDSALCLILLNLSIVMGNGNGFNVTQPRLLVAVEGSSVDIPCSFTYPERYNPTNIYISWRRRGFHGEFIFNVSKGYTHPDYQGRIEFLGHPYRDRTGTIRINDPKQSDQNLYFCRVETTGDNPEMWQSIPGTQLNVEAWRQPPKTPTPTPPTTTGFRDTAGQDRSKKLIKPTLWIGCTVAGLLFISLGLVAAVCIWRKKKKKEGQQRGKIQQGEQTGVPGLRDNPPMERDPQQTGSPGQPQAADEGDGSEGIVYATLRVSGGPPAKHMAEPADNNVLYAAVKFRPGAN